MGKRIFTLLIVIALLFSAGCSNLPTIGSQSSSSGKFEIVRKSQLGTKWQMYQLKIEVGNTEMPVILKLADGDRVDGYFYTEKGDNVAFRVTGNSQVYDSVPQGAASVTGGVASDRFAFSASQGQGSTYSMTFRGTSGDKNQKVTVFMEVILPVAGSIFTPLEIK
ncbi:MAG: hypothetical protein HYX79_00840 [Chloroflexi bacterium]|nr:hypothetical protein [Chloroflexota bacterium]